MLRRPPFAAFAARADATLVRIAGEKGTRIRELTSCVQKRFKFPENSVELYAEKVANRGLCAVAQAESLRYKLLGGLAVRRCANPPGAVAVSADRGARVRLRAWRAAALLTC